MGTPVSVKSPRFGLRGNRVVRILAVLVILIWMSNGARADPPAGGASKLPQVTVEGERARLERRVNAFISQITLRSDHESLARWNIPICPLVSGLPKETGEVLLTRLSEIAVAVRAPLDSAQCRPNLYVLVASDPFELLRAWRKKDPYIFGVLAADDPRHAPPAKVERFLRTERPVRVWYNFNNPDAGGGTSQNPRDTLADARAGFSADAAANGGGIDLPHLSWDTILNLTSVIVVIDSHRTNGITAGQLADYVAMVTFTQINLDKDPSTPTTILRLFAASATEEPAPSSLSTWDRGFLKGLYQTNQASKLQRFTIAHSIAQDLLSAGR